MKRHTTRRNALKAGLALSAIAALPACQTEKSLDADVIIMGAGLSGLYAAMLLEAEGLDVLVVEALPRVGGRMFTLNHDGGFTEGGGQQIGASYARLLDVAATLNVPLYEQTARGPDTGYFLNETWTTDTLTVPQFPAAFESTPPSSVLFRLLANEPGLESADSWLTAPEAFDISAAQFLTERGFSPDAQALIERALNANQLDTYSMLNLHRSWQLYKQSGGMGATQYVEGGSQRLPEAMAASLKRPVIMNSPISAISVSNTDCKVQTQSRTYRAKHAVCTLPFPALQKIGGIIGASAVQRQAFAALPYTQIMEVHMQSSAPFWEADQIGPSIWTDTELERVFANTDRTGALNNFHTGWVNGEGVEAWMSKPDPKAAYADRLAALRPATRGAMNPLALIDWTAANPYAGGAYYHWKPGQAQRFATDMGKSIGNLHFAGEHLGLLHTGMEAAMESGERAAIDIIEGRV